MNDDLACQAAKGISLLLAQISDLLGQMREVERPVRLLARDAAQLARLELCPGVEVLVLEPRHVRRHQPHIAQFARQFTP
jgi:hypothetical protein